MTTAEQAARELVRLATGDVELMTQLRLQKLLYYCQGWHLAWFGRPLFGDELQAWRGGPVVPAVYDLRWADGANPIRPEVVAPPVGLSAADRKAVAHVWQHYRQFSACGLEQQTHGERPWLDHYRPDDLGRCQQPIPLDALQTSFEDEYRRRTGDTVPESPEPAAVVLTLDELRAAVGR